jgi:hypothetical protein
VTSTKRDVALGVAGVAGILLALFGVLQLLEGVAMLANGSDIVETAGDALGFSATAQGWVHLVVGLAAVVVGVAVVTRHTVGYLAGTAIAFLGAVTNFFLLPYQPAWALVALGMNVLVIWALCHLIGRERVEPGYYDAVTDDGPARR